jgi:predicted GIY-YIG superfamily endonuclease
MSPVTYLIHLDQRLGSSHPNGSAGHYVGTTVDRDRRLATHREGKGARILAAANERGITYSVVRTWPGGRDVERRIKAQRNAPRFCPRCTT